MDLESARGVKKDLEAHFASVYRGPGRRRRKFALGVAAGSQPTQYGIAVRAETEKDLPESALESIRESADHVDVRYIGRIEPLSVPAGAVRGVAIGASIAHFLCSAGTLGFFARKTSDQSIGFVSNNHVIAAEDKGADGDEILHPALMDRGERPRDVVAHLVGGYPRLRQSKTEVDCAFARLVEAKAYDRESLDEGRRLSPMVVPPEAKLRVSKIGRTSGLTHGRVSAFEIDPPVHYSFGKLHFREQIEIEPSEGSPFACGGDSGSLVFTRDDCHPVGLLYAASTKGGPSGHGLSYANPIDFVLKALGVTFLT